MKCYDCQVDVEISFAIVVDKAHRRAMEDSVCVMCLCKRLAISDKDFNERVRYAMKGTLYDGDSDDE